MCASVSVLLSIYLSAYCATKATTTIVTFYYNCFRCNSAMEPIILHLKQSQHFVVVAVLFLQLSDYKVPTINICLFNHQLSICNRTITQPSGHRSLRQLWPTCLSPHSFPTNRNMRNYLLLTHHQTKMSPTQLSKYSSPTRLAAAQLDCKDRLSHRHSHHR